MCIVAVHGGLELWSWVLLLILGLVCFVLTLIIWRQPESKTKLSFKVSVSYAKS